MVLGAELFAAQASKEKAPMTQNKYPEGWDEARVRQLLAFYEAQTEEEAVAEDEAGVEASETVMRIPRELVPVVRELIAKRKS